MQLVNVAKIDEQNTTNGVHREDGTRTKSLKYITRRSEGQIEIYKLRNQTRTYQNVQHFSYRLCDILQLKNIFQIQA